MVHLFDPGRLASLVSARRQEAVRPRELLQRLGLAPGQVILDLGCGAGFFTLPAAALVGPAGQVIATDVQPEMVLATQQAAAAAGLTNIGTYLTAAYELPPGLPPVDWVVLAYVLHEVADPRRLLALAKDALKPGGRLLVLEWPQVEGPHGPPLAERLGPAALAALYQTLDLELQEFLDGAPEYYALVLQPCCRPQAAG